MDNSNSRPGLETALLILQLSLRDLDLADDDDGSSTDEDLALQLQTESIRILYDQLNDYRFALSVEGRVIVDDEPVLAFHAESLENLLGPLQDYCLSRRQNRALNSPEAECSPILTHPSSIHGNNDSPRSRPESLLSTDTSDSEDFADGFVEGEAIPIAYSHEAGPSSTKQPVCAVCLEDVPSSSFLASCGHYYCSDCLCDLVEASTRDEALYPPHCCQNLPVDDVTPFLRLRPHVISQFRTKSLEFGTPVGSRVYCANPRCSVFIGPSTTYIANIVCPQCQTLVCSGCNCAAHPGDTCSGSAAFQELKDLAQVNRWQTCPGCNSIVERTEGCPHMICRCSVQFCYHCALPWKSCSCP